jgi:hypothetical protein
MTGGCRLGASAITALLVGCSSLSSNEEASLCAPPPVRSDALDDPSKHAWNLFLALNHPAKDEKVARGEPDCSKRFGAPGSTSVWETWRNAETEVFLEDGSEPPVWQDMSLPDEKPGATPEITTMFPQTQVLDATNRNAIMTAATHGTPMTVSQGLRAGSVSVHGQRALTDDGFRPMFSPTDGVFQDEGGFGETRMNKATYEFIRENCLFSREGGQRYAKAVAAGKKPPISFPAESIEAKAAWLDFEREKIPQEKWATYYTATYKGKRYGLVALHIITKDIPNWFWATFHHKDAPENPHEVKDTYGPPSAVKGTVWENYKLGGTQIDFVTPTGGATILSDHYVEFKFQRSSCITCHATATISPTTPMTPSGQPRSLCALNGAMPEIELPLDTCKQLIGEDAYRPGTDRLISERGAPDPRWFLLNGKPYFLQTDFVFAIPFRAFKRREAKPPPPRCIW